MLSKFPQILPSVTSRSLAQGLGLALIFLSGCASYQSEYETRLIGSLPNQREVTIDEAQSFPGDVLCGRYTSLTGQGFSFVTRDFVVTPYTVLNRASELELSVFCAKNPRAALLENTGLGAWDDDLQIATRLRDDMRAIDNAIRTYYRTRHGMPKNLDVLLGEDLGLDETSLLDPWGKRYRYDPGLSGRTKPIFELISYGADGLSGGSGENADMRYSQLELLEHMLRVEGL